MIRFLLDMGLAKSTAEFLRSLGHNAVHIRDEGLQRLPDERIVIKAHLEGRTIITHDLDFGRIVALSGETVPSIVTACDDARRSRKTERVTWYERLPGAGPGSKPRCAPSMPEVPDRSGSPKAVDPTCFKYYIEHGGAQW